jgi:hypothetical protein
MDYSSIELVRHFNVVAAERVTAVDPTSRAIWLKKFSAEESRRVAPMLPRRWRPSGW